MAHSPLGDCRERLDTGGFGLQYGFSSEETCRLQRFSSPKNVTHVLGIFVIYVLEWFNKSSQVRKVTAHCQVMYHHCFRLQVWRRVPPGLEVGE
jgi:hypothetical protein